MLQLKHLRYIQLMTGCPYNQIQPVKFGYSIGYSAVTTYVLASQLVPENMSLLVLRTQCYLVNQDETASDYGFYRTIPYGDAYWQLARDTSNSIQNWTNASAPSQLVLDTDELLIFPGGKYANLRFLPADAAPAGSWFLQTTVYGYFVPPIVSEAFSVTTQWINEQQ